MLIVVLVGAALLAAALLMLLPKKLKAVLRIRSSGLTAKITFYALFRIIKIELPVSAVFRYPYGFVLFVGGKRYRVIERLRKRPLPALGGPVKLKKLSVLGRAGIKGSPDKSVLLAGAIGSALSCVWCLFSDIKPNVCIEPELEGTAFFLNIEGILEIDPGKLMIETIKLGRRKKNESSNRKHNAVVNGARKEAC